MPTKIIPAVPGPKSDSPKVRKRVEETRKEVRKVEAKLDKSDRAAKSPKPGTRAK